MEIKVEIDYKKTSRYFAKKKREKYYRSFESISKEKQLAKNIARPIFGYFADKLVDKIVRR